MFAALVPGKLVQAVIQVTETAFSLELTNAESINHICVFLTGSVPFPEGYAASVHLQLPGGRPFQLIGSLSNERPSAIFRLRGTVVPSDVSSFAGTASLSVFSAMLGISIEASALVEAQIQAAGLSDSTTSKQLVVRGQAGADSVELATQIAKYLYNAVASYAQVSPDGSSWIDLKTLEKSFLNLAQKLRNSGTGFLSRQD